MCIRPKPKFVFMTGLWFGGLLVSAIRNGLNMHANRSSQTVSLEELVHDSIPDFDNAKPSTVREEETFMGLREHSYQPTPQINRLYQSMNTAVRRMWN